jgi:hypothetical protein
MKEYVLEQLVDDFLKHEGYFTRHNIKFRPRSNHPKFNLKQDVVPSDIDVVAINPNRKGSRRVIAVSCKSWQAGFDPARKILEIRKKRRIAGRPAWKRFRELIVPKWSEAFISKLREVSGSRRFTYWVVVTHLKKSNSRYDFQRDKQFRKAIRGCAIRIVTLNEILDKLYPALTKIPAASEIGRALQLMKAAKWRPPR